MKSGHPYYSPLRAEQAAATRARIVDACVAVIGAERELTFGAVAKAAGVQERTVYRHFATKNDLEAAVWTWIVENLTQAEFSHASEDELITAMRRSFAGFDAGASLIEAMLHSRQGLAIRQAQQPARRAMFERCARQAVPGVNAQMRARLAATLQLLYSATAWDQLRAFWDMDADAAADTVETAIRLVLAGARQQTGHDTRRRHPSRARGTAPRATEETSIKET
jgi:AcrR family transcriptional regulator